MPEEIERIRALVGGVSGDQLRFVDCFVSRRVGLFIPSVGPCFYAVTPDHAHPSYSFVLAFDDRSRIAAGGRILRPQPGTVLAIDPGAVHHEILDEEPSRYVAIFIDREFFEAQLGLYPGLPKEPFAFRTFPPGKDLPLLLKEFMNEYEGRLPGSAAVLEALETAIAHALIRACHRIERKAARGSGRVEIHQVIEHLHGHFEEKLTVADMAKIAAMSPSHFSRVFKQETGRSPLDYLILLRLEKARKLLRAGDGSITEIALRCGFASPSHFTARFQQHFRQAPSEYLKTLR